MDESQIEEFKEAFRVFDTDHGKIDYIFHCVIFEDFSSIFFASFMTTFELTTRLFTYLF